MATRNGSIVRMNVTQKPASARKKNAPMLNKTQFNKELQYQLCASLVLTMRKYKLLTRHESRRIRLFWLKKFNPLLGRLFASVETTR